MRKKSNHVIKKNAKEDSKRGKEGQKNYKTDRKQLTKWQELVLPCQ